MKTLLLIILCINFSITIVIAQNILLYKGQSCTFTSAKVRKNSKVFSKELCVGYSSRGKLDLGFSAPLITGKYLGIHYLFATSISYLIVKQNRLSISIETFSNYQIKRYVRTNTIKDTSLNLGIGFYRKRQLSKNISLSPGFYFNREFTKRSLDSKTERLSANRIGFESNLLIKKLLISPGMCLSHNNSTFSLKSALLFAEQIV